MSAKSNQTPSKMRVKTPSGAIAVDTTPLPLNGTMARFGVAQWRTPREGVMELSPRNWRVGLGAVLVALLASGGLAAILFT